MPMPVSRTGQNCLFAMSIAIGMRYIQVDTILTYGSV